MARHNRIKKNTPMKKSGKKRIFIIGVVLSALLLLLVSRIGYWQIIKGNELQKAAIEQQTRDRVINSKRGSILDTNGKQLAVSASVETINAAPSQITANSKNVAPEKIAKELSDILEIDYDETLKKITKNSSYEIIKRKVEKTKADKIREFIDENNVKGITLDADTKRYYPYGSFAAQVIGFTGTDNQGLDGVEMMYDKYLKGTSGRVISAKDARGAEMPFEYEKMIDAKDGLNVVLTIDENIQRITEKYLQTALVENKIENGAACIVMEVKTGNVLAMATKPDYDLNDPFTIQDPKTAADISKLSGKEKSQKYQEALTKMWRNKAVVDTYEPGSTFKIFTLSMALEENLVSLADRFYCGGSYKVGDRDISCWKAAGHGSQDYIQAIQNSCNPAFIQIGLRIGTEKFFNYFYGFGFQRKTGIDLPGEAIGPFHQRNGFHDIQLATSSFGQSFSVTPLQMITGVSAVANGGKLMKPKVVKQLTDNKGNIVKTFDDVVVRQIISEETSQKMCKILGSVVSDGSGSSAYIKGFRVAGKTGTSEKLPRGNGKYIASFVGFAPYDDPQIAILLMLDEPMGGEHFGGIIAAPVARNILEESLNYLNIEPAYTPEELATLETSVPNVTGMTYENAKKVLLTAGLKCDVSGKGDTVENQIPKAGVKVNQQSTIMLYTDKQSNQTMTTVPNVLNCSTVKASQLISQANLNISIIGAGANPKEGDVISYKQSPTAGTQIEIGKVVTVEFKRIEAGE